MEISGSFYTLANDGEGHHVNFFQSRVDSCSRRYEWHLGRMIGAFNKRSRPSRKKVRGFHMFSKFGQLLCVADSQKLEVLGTIYMEASLLCPVHINLGEVFRCSA